MITLFSNPVKINYPIIVTVGLFLICLFSRCGLLDSDINKDTHKSQIVVSLTGEYAKSEIATVSIDGVVEGMASLNEVVTKEVQPGMYKVSAVDKKGKPAWSSLTIEVKENQTFNVHLECDAVKFTAHISQFCEQKATYPLRLFAYNEKGEQLSVTNAYFFTGEDGGTAYFDHGDISIIIADEKNKIIWQNASVFFPYGSSYSVNVFCP